MSDEESYTYAKAGVDIAAGNALVKAIGPLAKATARPGADAVARRLRRLLRPRRRRAISDPLLVAANDGVGTKLKLAIDSDRHDGVGIDLVAMCANDLIVQGAEPLFFLDYFATGKLDSGVAERVIAVDRRGLPAGRLRPDRRRDGGDAGHVCRGRLRPCRLLRRRGRARRGADRRQGGRGRRHSRPRLLRRSFERLLAGPPARRRQGLEARPAGSVRPGPAADRRAAGADAHLCEEPAAA